MLSLDGRHIGDSTAAIAALEEAFPEPPLYPSDPDERRRALALEDFVDEELTAAALLYPIVLPKGSPLSRVDLPRTLASELGDRPGLRWVEAIYERHRRPSRVPAS